MTTNIPPARERGRSEHEEDRHDTGQGFSVVVQEGLGCGPISSPSKLTGLGAAFAEIERLVRIQNATPRFGVISKPCSNGAMIGCLLAAFSGCTSFATPRSAAVNPGLHLLTQASLGTPPGDGAAWFWALDCAVNCDRVLPAFELNLTYGSASVDGGGRSLGVGLNGDQPYVEGYQQFGDGDHNPWGIGGRLGLALGGWHEHRVFLRFDRTLGSRSRLLLNPGLFLHTGKSPNGLQRGTFVAVSQSVGFEQRPSASSSFTWAPSVTLVLGRGSRTNFDTFGSGFLVASVTVTF